MGDRGNIELIFADHADHIFFYTHYDGSRVLHILRRALRKRWRWDDPTYLARIIFCELVKGSEADETGYGIGLSICDNEHPIPKVFLNEQRVVYQGQNWSFDGFCRAVFDGDGDEE